MDQQHQAGRAPDAGQHSSDINTSRSPSPAAFPIAGDVSLSTGLGLGPQLQQQQQQYNNNPNPSFNFNPNTDFLDSQPNPSNFDPSMTFDQSQSSYLSPDLNNGDFSLFPTNGSQPNDQYSASLFDQSTLNPNDLSNMASPQAHHSPTPPHLLHPEGHPGSAHQSPSFNQHQFSSPPAHSRNVSLGPEAALLPHQMGDWTQQPQFQNHRRTPSEYSDVSSVTHSPNLVGNDSFDVDPNSNSPMQRASNGSQYQDLLNIGNFSISETQVRSPSHSPAISPRLTPEQLSTAMGMLPGQSMYPGTQEYAAMQGPNDSFPALQQNLSSHDVSQMAPPAINIDLAPSTGLGFDNKAMDQASLTPPDRGRPKSRPRAVTDPFHQGAGTARPVNKRNSLSPSLSPDPSRNGSSRSLSPLDRSLSPSKRRQSTSAVPNNVMALRLADPDYQGSPESGSTKRIQKHPATFQCTLCPKRFTRAYNLRSHLRTHTDERPFVCTVCGKAFARQHDRKRHESLHSGEKKFVCKGDLKAGGQWGCGRRFARADALGRHFRSEAGRICIKSLLDEEMLERQRQWQEQRMQENMQNMSAQQSMGMDSSYPMDASGNYLLPAALLAQYPALAQMNWSAPDMAGGLDDDLSGAGSFDASDFDEGDDGGYVSGPGAGFGEGSMSQGYGEMGYNSDLGGR